MNKFIILLILLIALAFELCDSQFNRPTPRRPPPRPRPPPPRPRSPPPRPRPPPPRPRPPPPRPPPPRPRPPPPRPPPPRPPPPRPRPPPPRPPPPRPPPPRPSPPPPRPPPPRPPPTLPSPPPPRPSPPPPSPGERPPPPPIPTIPQYQYFILAMQWPATFCSFIQPCPRIPQDFTIHGLWPQLTTFIGHEELTDDILDARESQLLEYWPDLTTDDFQVSKDFWYHQYETHGRYCTTKFSPEEYFDEALELGESYNIRSIYNIFRIIPSDFHPYPRHALMDAIRFTTGFTPNIECHHVGGFRTYLLEVRLCFDKDLGHLIHCAGTFGICDVNVFYTQVPHFPPHQLNQTMETLVG